MLLCRAPGNDPQSIRNYVDSMKRDVRGKDKFLKRKSDKKKIGKHTVPNNKINMAIDNFRKEKRARKISQN